MVFAAMFAAFLTVAFCDFSAPLYKPSAAILNAPNVGLNAARLPTFCAAFERKSLPVVSLTASAAPPIAPPARTLLA